MLLQGIRLQIINALLMIIKYLILIGIGVLLGLVLNFVPGVETFLTKYGLTSVTFMTFLTILSSSLGNIFGKQSQ